MPDRTAQPSTNQQRSLAAFLAARGRFEALVADLQGMAADHLGADPDATLWAETTALQHANALLAQVTAPYFRRGEFAP